MSERIKRKKLYRVSLKRQITAIFVSVMALTIGICWLVNTVFLEKFYFINKEKTLLNVYRYMVDSCNNKEIYDESFDIQLQKYSGTHNVSIVIITSAYEPFKIYANEPGDDLIKEIIQYISGTIDADNVIENNSDYLMIQKNDSRIGTDYIEMWGVLPDGALFLLRTAIESIKVSAGLANRFLLYIGAGAVLVSAVVIYLITRRISKPILEIANISERVSDMDFEARYEGNNRSEIGVLGESINKMSQNLENAINDLKEANYELQKDNELKTRIDEMRKEFVSNVSHELKTPIALVQGYAEGLKESVNEADERDYYCDVIIDEATKMNVMVKQLLTLNQIESGMDVLSKESFDLVTLIKNYIQSAEILTRQKGILVSFDGPVECYVFADEFKIEEVFMNYFSNALNHCESDSEKRIDVEVKKTDNKVKVFVSNTCEGIPEENLAHLWEKFYKVDKARTREYGGSGIGLSIVKAIMEAHNGEYGVFNTDDGVCFLFSLDEEIRIPSEEF